MKNYYYLSASLPTLEITKKPEIEFSDFIFLANMNLDEKDLKIFKKFRSFIDINNLKLYWQHKTIDYRGNFSEKEIAENIFLEDLFPSYVTDFVNKYESEEDRLNNFSYLLVSFFKDVEENEVSFFKKYFRFEREFRLTLLALRAKKNNFDIARQLQFEDENDPFVMNILAQKDAPSIEIDEKFSELKDIYNKDYENPLTLYKKILEYKFKKIEDFIELIPFSIDRILAFFQELLMVEDWDSLNDEKANEMIINLVV